MTAPISLSHDSAPAHQKPLASSTTSSKAPYVQQTVAFLDGVFGKHSKADFIFRLWEGTVWRPEKAVGTPAFTIVLNHPAALRRMFLPPTDSTLAVSYVLGDFEMEGDAEKALNLGQELWETWTWTDLLRSAFKLVTLPRKASAGNFAPQLTGATHSVERDRQAIKAHYDVSNDFYKLWLDERMVYSCGYFRSETDSVDDAQRNKLDIICRKLRLKPGDRLLDIGCGWGALVIHAAKNYGVTAVGVTLSDNQIDLARERVAEAGLSDRVSIELIDYRNIDETNRFDKIVSVGMVEHVGRQNLREYFDKAYRLLKPGGVFLNHGITILFDVFKSQKELQNGFLGKYIFPDGDLQPIPYILKHADDAKFEIRDVESLRYHYALTLRCWRAKFEQHEEKIKEMHGVDMYRLWRLYLIAAAWGFANGLHSLIQTVLYKPRDDEPVTADIPLTRDDWYTEH